MPVRAMLLALTGIVASHLVAPLLATAQEFPYTAYVNTEGAYYRSGPGANYYPTGKLPQGEAVEVYRHDRGGWCAVRPPLGSFSWVDSKHLRPTGDGLAVVTQDDVLTAVGSHFSDIREVQQVRLERGEEVEVLEQVQFGDGDAAELWFKIAPPAGEFRWIAIDQLSEERPQAAPKKTGRRNLLIDENEPAPRTAAGAAPILPRVGEQRTGGQRMASSSRSDGWRADRKAASDPSTAAVSRPGDQPKLSEAEIARQLDLLDLELSHRVAEEPTAWSFEDLLNKVDALTDQSNDPALRGRAGTLSRRLKRFDEIRRRQVALGDQQLEAKVRAPRGNSPSPQTATAQPRVASQIRNMEGRVAAAGKQAERAIASVTGIGAAASRSPDPAPGQAPPPNDRQPSARSNPTPAITDEPLIPRRAVPATTTWTAAGTSPRSRREAGENKPDAAPAAPEERIAARTSENFTETSSVAGDGRFDGHGRLTRVASQRPGMPQYALVDESGTVRQYLTAAPGVNLRRYVGHQVGVQGLRGYLPELNAHHITAKRVTPIDGTVLR